jgi:hypothetical protein
LQLKYTPEGTKNTARNDVHEERKQLSECTSMQPAAQHNEVMVKKYAIESLPDVICWECRNATIMPIPTAKGNLVMQTYEGHPPPARLEVTETI